MKQPIYIDDQHVFGLALREGQEMFVEVATGREIPLERLFAVDLAQIEDARRRLKAEE